MFYGFAMLPQTYLFSFAFTVPSSGFTRLSIFNIILGEWAKLTKPSALMAG